MENLFLMFLDHTQRRTTVGRTPLHEWSARRKDLYLTTHDTHNRQIPMPRWDSNPRSQQVSGFNSSPFRYNADTVQSHSRTKLKLYKFCYLMQVFLLLKKCKMNNALYNEVGQINFKNCCFPWAVPVHTQHKPFRRASFSKTRWKNCEKQLLAPSRLSIRTSSRMEQLGSHRMDSHKNLKSDNFSKVYREKIHVWLKSDNNNGYRYFTWRLMCISLNSS